MDNAMICRFVLRDNRGRAPIAAITDSVDGLSAENAGRLGRHAAAINAARRGDFEAVQAYADTLGGLTQKQSWVRAAMAAARKLESDIPAYRIRMDGGRRFVEIPDLGWHYRAGRQTAYIRWIPLWAAPARPAQ